MTTKRLSATREKILKLVAESDLWKGKGESHEKKEHLSNLSLEDVIDLVLLYISLQPDRRRITRIRINEFLALVEHLWKKGAQNARPGHFLRLLRDEWLGPIVDIGSLKHFEWLSSWFSFWNPELGSSKLIGNIIGWRQYSKHFASEVLPKFKEPIHQEELDNILVFADLICENLRLV